MVAEKQDVLNKLRALEREYHRIAQNPPARHLNSLRQFLVWMEMEKPPFKPGDDVWNRMEEKTREFLEDMSRRH